MHIGQGVRTDYYMADELGNRVRVEVVEIEKDLGIYVSNDLKSSTQCTKSASKSRSVQSMLKRNIKRLDIADLVIIYKTYIRPHL